jgi:superfamily II DNA helicase RecQ
MLMPGMTVVVSPLIALMQDQFEKMTALGITSVQVNSAATTVAARRCAPRRSPKERREIRTTSARSGRYRRWTCVPVVLTQD